MDYFMTRIGWIVYDSCRRSGGRDSDFDTTDLRRVRCAYLLHSQDGANWLADVEEGAMLRANIEEDIPGSTFPLPPILGDLEEDPCSCPQGIHPLTFSSRSHPISLPTSSSALNTLFSPTSAYTDTPSTSDPAYDFSGFATTTNTSVRSVETIKSPLKDENTGVTRTQRRGWEFHR
ncbi:hypothetical protein M422DRAFT_253898 [Sphaerobolus stellatus SS14]|uniref:Uncharacterized protein n=1 Tax=Sphaerobolus stellatus (strain SS14) TaxID=990650 RepID=A0A0C9VVS7_SPHS4|nr:hypothetical protein M422DRAFT_253898 [Sphaerobolus stellatus SS14]